ncbi:hypothetical protein E6C60_1337 [Paenibacillus algicola]|uniref:Uncharacterized protein n=1 Tax=Paenibacillus algicola TaxID=2565926 RepID=A0A4P8XIL6_9BACL|nr:hypothetical protein E6C60_1337 [Paenibacillus algicola]
MRRLLHPSGNNPLKFCSCISKGDGVCVMIELDQAGKYFFNEDGLQHVL